MATDESDRYRAPALDKGLDIFELLAETDGALSQAEIAKSLGRTPNEIYRMLDRLVRREYIRRTPEDRYEITLKMFELVHARPPLRRLVNQAVPLLQKVAQESGQSCHLVVFDRNAAVVVAQVDAPSYWTLAVRVGTQLKLTSTGSGLVFLAFSSAENRALMLKGAGETMSPQVEALLESIRRDGYTMMPSEQIAGVTNLSAPVIGPLGSVMAVVTSPYTERLDRDSSEDRAHTLELVRAAAANLSKGRPED
ncbi:IclR family transcriptional regulator [Martelella radicis]|uniref:DNA-binding IclR family transcriptional regulator n=1 Tax=Martelella radicis TaxID=1397476 RepID=A0A7W6KLA4_9HYPH|nr:IclR family transcriptional regulator [Martelella radicis]MBB4123328.1 DNA-binding IclR family transcriptional regulator [Martelella radicis]